MRRWNVTNQFMARLAIAMVVVGGGYLLIAHPAGLHRRPHEPVAEVRADLDEMYLAWGALAKTRLAGTQAGVSLPQLRAQLVSARQALQKAVQQAGSQLTTAEQSRISKIGKQVAEATSDFDGRFSLIGQLVTYDPALDLGQLHLPADASVLTQRAAAAEAGLTTILSKSAQPTGQISVQSGAPAPLISDDLKKKLQAQISCFYKLSQDQLANMAHDRTQCLAAYPGIQSAARATVIAPFSSNNLNDVPSLLKQLDQMSGHR